MPDWLIEQGVPVYDEMNDLFSHITSPLRAQDLDITNPQIYKMVFMALYNLDKFRNFIFQCRGSVNIGINGCYTIAKGFNFRFGSDG